MQDFDEYFFQPSIAADGVIVAPTGDGAEAFIHADDIADVAAATLLAPAAHAGAEYALSGPEALTFARGRRADLARRRPAGDATSTRRSTSGSPRRRGGHARSTTPQLLGWLFDQHPRQRDAGESATTSSASPATRRAASTTTSPTPRRSRRGRRRPNS